MNLLCDSTYKKLHIQAIVQEYNFPGDSTGKEPAGKAGDLSLIPGPGKSPGEGNDYPLQNFCLENSMDRGAWWAPGREVTKSRTRLSD